MRKLAKNLHAEIDINSVVKVVIALVVSAMLIAALLPNAIQNNTRSVNTNGNQYIGAENTTHWRNVSGLGSTWDSIPIIEVLAALMIFVMIAIRLMKG